MLSHEFVRNALFAGTFVALACGLVGYFVVLRRAVFAGDALSHVAFTGALAAAAAGLDSRFGLFVGTLLAGALLGAAGRSAEADDAAIGTAFVWILGLGVLLLATGAGGEIGVRTLFGGIFGVSSGEARLAALLGLATALLLLMVARPLLFASIDPRVAAARGVPVRGLSVVFLALVGVVAAEATQVVGALLLLGLLGEAVRDAHRLGEPHPRRSELLR
ncbi:MAG: metal ABC transporter permease, partial [Solirubrobacteraceae bacterium]